MADCDFSKLSKRQREALSSVAFGGEGLGFPPATMASLERRGLIVAEQREDHSQRFTLRYTAWSMPFSVHVDFCAWCDENAEPPREQVESEETGG